MRKCEKYSNLQVDPEHIGMDRMMVPLLSSMMESEQGDHSPDEERAPHMGGQPTLVPHNSPHRVQPQAVENPHSNPRYHASGCSATGKGSEDSHNTHSPSFTGEPEGSRSPSPAEEAMAGLSFQEKVTCKEKVLSSIPLTSTPVSSTSSTPACCTENLNRSRTLSAVFPTLSEGENELTASNSSSLSTHSTHCQTDFTGDTDQFTVPIVGYEIMDERARFTVYKIHVQKNKLESWFIFRRYNDFLRLNERLREIFPHFRLSLPPKKWFGDNFDKEFLDDRLHGLQAFLNNVVGHRDVANSEPVQDFFCFADPPGPHDSLEESRATCEALEYQLYTMKTELREKNAHITLLEEELALQKAEIENLRKSLRLERALNASHLSERTSPSVQSQKSESSMPEQEQRSGVDAEDGPLAPSSISAASGNSRSPGLDALPDSSFQDMRMTKVKSSEDNSSAKRTSLLPAL